MKKEDGLVRASPKHRLQKEQWCASVLPWLVKSAVFENADVMEQYPLVEGV